MAVSESAEADARMVGELERSIGGRSDGRGDAEVELARLTSDAAESRKLSSVEADVEAWLERVSAAKGPLLSTAADMLCGCYGEIKAEPMMKMRA